MGSGTRGARGGVERLGFGIGIWGQGWDLGSGLGFGVRIGVSGQDEDLGVGWGVGAGSGFWGKI